MATTFEIRVKGHLPPHWSEWLEGLTITHDPNGETVLAGPLRDQAELFGVVMKVRDLGLTLLSVNQREETITENHSASPKTKSSRR